MTYSPFRAQKRMDEWSKGCPAYWRTAEEKVEHKGQQSFPTPAGGHLSWPGELCALTLPVDTQHDWSVVGMQVKQDGSADQVLGEIPEEGNCPEANKYQAKTLC